MLGRMMTQLITVCHGFNAILMDSDIVLYTDPLKHVFFEADITVFAGPIYPTVPEWFLWAGHFFSDRPTDYVTFSNTYCKSTESARQYLFSVVLSSMAMLKGHPTPGFLQVAVVSELRDRNLLLYPYG